MTILEKIVAHKSLEVEEKSAQINKSELERSELFNRVPLSLSASVLDSTRTGIIAEFKRKSPSKGLINSSASVAEVTSGYFRYGASGVSVLTDSNFFGGSSEDLIIAREKNNFPILRKDFIINEYQIIESKAIGADAILLIAAALTKRELLDFSRTANSLGLEVLLEIHCEEELDGINENVNIIGVNNRNLKTFEVDTKISEELIHLIPSEFIKISESGINSYDTIKKLRQTGFNGFLIGETFMKTSDPVKAFSEFISEMN